MRQAQTSAPAWDARLDMNDLYAFPKPGDPGRSILIFNVHPVDGREPSAPHCTRAFAPGALYRNQR